MVVEGPARGDVLAGHEGLEDVVNRLGCGIGAAHAVVNDDGSLQLSEISSRSLEDRCSRGKLGAAVHTGEGGGLGVKVGA